MDLICPVFQRFALVRLKLWSPVSVNFHFSILPDQITSRHQLFQTFEERILTGHIGQAHVDLEHLFVQLFFESRLSDDVTDHRAVQKFAVFCLIIIERLGSELIS